jgi:hypothetical protein
MEVPVYDAIWNMAINFKYLLSKPENAEYAVRETGLIVSFARAYSWLWRRFSVDPRP